VDAVPVDGSYLAGRLHFPRQTDYTIGQVKTNQSQG